MLRWALAAALALAAPPHLLEGDVLPPEVCARIIDAAERQGFSYAPDTIDRDDSLRPPSVQLEVFEQDEVRAPEVMSLVEPYLPRLREITQTWDQLKRWASTNEEELVLNGCAREVMDGGVRTCRT